MSELMDELARTLSPRATLVVQGDANYEAEREQIGWWRNTESEAAHRISPSAICVPDSEDDVRAIVRFAGANGYAVVPRSGGHQISGLSSGGADEPTIQIDMRRFVELTVEHESGSADKGRRVVVGAGVRLKELTQLLCEHDLFVPCGICANVCVGGHYQSSAFGMFARSFGLGIDYITHIRLCLASGEIVTVSASDEEHLPLFWALRGGSPGAFGIVLEYQFHALDVRSFKHAHISRLYWSDDGPTGERVFGLLRQLMDHPAYAQRRDMTLYAGWFPDLYNPYYASDDSTPKTPHTLVVYLGWSGVDSGSIYGPIPSELLGSSAAGTTFHQQLVEPLTQVPGLLDVSGENGYADDPKHTLTYLTRLIFGSNVVGSLAEIKKDRHGLLPPSRAEINARYVETADAHAERCAVDVSTEASRYTTLTNFTVRGAHFDEDAFTAKLLRQVAVLEATPHVWAMVQIFHQDLLPDESSAFPTRGDYYAYDIWVMWRPTLGQEVEDAARAWAKQTEELLTGAMGAAPLGQIWCTGDEVDVSNERHRRLYYPDDDHFRKLQRVKHSYDPSDVFRTRFTVPPEARQQLEREAGAETLAALRVPAPADARLLVSALRSGQGSRYHTSRDYNILTGRMRSHALGKSGEPYLTWINDDGSVQSTLTFGELYNEVAAYAGYLQQDKGVQRGDRLVLCYLPGPDFIKVFLACLFIGAVPVPVYPVPIYGGGRARRFMQKFNHIVRSCEPKYILVDKSTTAYRTISATHSLLGSKGPPWVIVEPSPEPLAEPVKMEEDEVAFIQFTSGTTGPAKGAVLTHKSLMSQFKLLQDELDFHDDGVALMWVPPYHDLGLMGSLLSCLMGGNHLYMMSPMALMRDPRVWFSSISRFKATHTGSPNFAFSMCMDKISDEELATWDLSSLRMIMSAGEPIEVGVMDALLERLQRLCKLSKHAYCPSYGLAENAVCITTGGTRVLRVDRARLSQGTLEANPDGVPISSCGRVLSNVPVAIVEGGVELEARAIGEIWISGPSVASSYLGDEHDDLDRSLPTRSGRWFRTGDIGFIDAGELFVIARGADTVAWEGRALYPNLIESDINAAVSGLRKGSTTFFQHPERGTLAVAVEPASSSKGPAIRAMAEAIREVVERAFEAPLASVFIMPRASSLKTSSGKLQRRQTGAAIADGTMRRLACVTFEGEQVRVELDSRTSRAAKLAGGVHASIRAARDVAGDVAMTLRTLGALDRPGP